MLQTHTFDPERSLQHIKNLIDNEPSLPWDLLLETIAALALNHPAVREECLQLLVFLYSKQRQRKQQDEN